MSRHAAGVRTAGHAKNLLHGVYVLDSSALLKWVLPEVDSGKAIRLRDEYKSAVHELIAPYIFTPEVANRLASAERQGRIKAGEAGSLLLDIVRQTPAIHPSSQLFIRAHRRRSASSHFGNVQISTHEQRKSTVVTHPVFGYKMSYGRMLEVQARMLAAYVCGDIPESTGFTVR